MNKLILIILLFLSTTTHAAEIYLKNEENISKSIHSSKEWYCPIHGPVSVITLEYDGKPIGHYCFLCANEAMKKYITTVTPIKEKNKK